MAKGREFEASVIARIVGEHHAVSQPGRADPAEREAATLRAIEAGAALIVGGRLPTDQLGRRSGCPALLVAEQPGSRSGPAYRPGPGYRAVDVRHHLTLEDADLGPGEGAVCSELSEPWLEAALGRGGEAARKRRGDLLTLAHYQAILEAGGLAAGGGRFAGVVGVEGRIVWHDLDAPIWTTPSSSGRQKRRSTMEVYAFEFDFRLDVIAIARRHRTDPSVEPLLVPVQIAECADCPWWVHCGPILEAGDGDVSLLAGIAWRQWKIHRDHGVNNRADLARLDPRTAALVAAGVDVAFVLGAAKGLPADTPVPDLVPPRRTAQLERLRQAGVLRASDARQLCERTASYSGAGLSALPAHIDAARAALGPEPAYRRRGAGTIEVPRADVEVDIDLESVAEGVYMWGTLVSDRGGCGIAEGYRCFVSWEPIVGRIEVGLFEDFWRWLGELRHQVRASGATFRSYCYSAGVERNNLLRLGGAAGCRSEVGELVYSAEWVDLLDVVRTYLLTGGGNGLKEIAPLAGYRWPVEDPGGQASTLMYATAVAPGDEGRRSAAREWLAAYNRGDVEATRALRQWLACSAGSLLEIENWVPTTSARSPRSGSTGRS